MRINYLICIIILFFVFLIPITAQESGTSDIIESKLMKNAVIFIPVGFGIGLIFRLVGIDVEYQRSLFDFLSFTIVPEIAVSFNGIFAIGATTGFCFMPLGNRLDGLYVKVGGGGGVIVAGSMYLDFWVSGTAGWQFIFKNGFILILGAGFRYDFVVNEGTLRLEIARMGFVF